MEGGGRTAEKEEGEGEEGGGRKLRFTQVEGITAAESHCSAILTDNSGEEIR